MTNLNQTSIITNSIYGDLKANKNLALVLGNNDKISTNSVDTFSKGLISSSIAFRLLSNNIKRVIEVPTAVNKVWIEGTTNPGHYESNTNGTQNRKNWCLFIQNGYLFCVLSTTEYNRTDQKGANIARYPLTDTTGNIACTPDGQHSYVCIQKMPDRLSDCNRNYIEIVSPTDPAHTYTTFGTEVSRKCGPGNQNVSGSCCIYNSAFEYDSITGATTDIGDLYGCFETKCYKCIELSNKLGMEYIFHAWAGITATEEEKCLSGDSETSTECGPCACSIDLTSKSYYSDILNDKDISSSVSSKQNAKFEKVNQERLSGAIASVWINVTGLTEEQKLMSESYKDVADLCVPLIGSGATIEAKIPIKTVRNRNGDKMLVGFSHPREHGYGYVSAEIDSSEWNNIFPNVDASRITINIIPTGGFPSNLVKIFNSGMLISKVITKEDIISTGTIQEYFNQWSIQEIVDENGMNVFSNYTDAQSRVMNISLVIEATKTGVLSFQQNDLPLNDASLEPPSSSAPAMKTTKIMDRVKKAAVSKTDPSKTVIELETAQPLRYAVGYEFTIVGDSAIYTIASVTRPKTDALTAIDLTQSIIHHIEKASINSKNDATRLQCYFGSNKG